MNQQEPPIRIAICDDQPVDRAELRAMCSAWLDRNELVATITEFPSGEAFLAADPDHYALAFLDIYMDGINGMETAKTLVAERKKTKLVFYSSSGEFAAESYDVAALHYLIKPAEQDKVFRVLDRFFADYRAKRTLTVKVGRHTESILLADIYYAEADNKKTKFFTKHGIIDASEPFSQVCEKLTPPEFVKPIRYAVVALKEVIAVPSDVLEISNGDTVPVSRGERAKVKQAFVEYKWMQSSMRR